MKIITRYIVFEVVKIFFVTAFLLTMMLMVWVLLKEAREQGLDPLRIVRVLPYALPETSRYTIPAAILFAVSCVYGRMSGSNEVVALKSLGISPMVVLWPVYWLAAVLSLTTVWMSEVAVSWGKENMRRQVLEGIEEIAYGMLRTNRSYTASNFSIIVKQVDGRRLIDPTITLQGGANSPSVTLTAAEAELKANLQANLLTIICRQGTLHVDGRARLRFDDTIERAIPLEAACPRSQGDPLPSQLPMGMLTVKRREREGIIEELQQRRAGKEAFALATGDFPAICGAEAADDRHHLDEHRAYWYRVKTEPHRRWSSGFSCLCFVMIGAPLAIWLRNSDVMTSFFACFLPILLIYYPLLAIGVEQSKDGRMPPIAVWLGNLIVAVAGAWLARRVVKF
jgi:lipopolysaccharide export system permease protein